MINPLAEMLTSVLVKVSSGTGKEVAQKPTDYLNDYLKYFKEKSIAKKQNKWLLSIIL